MAFDSSLAHAQEESADSKDSDISGLSTFGMDTTDTFDRRMAEQVHKQQILRRAAGGQPLFGRHRSSASLRSAMGSLDRNQANITMNETRGKARPQTEKTKDSLAHTSSQQWGLKSNNRTDAFRRALSNVGGRTLPQGKSIAEPGHPDLLRDHSLDIPVGFDEGIFRTHMGNSGKLDQMSSGLHDDSMRIAQDSPVSLRAERRTHFDYQNRGKATALHRTKDSRSKSLDSRRRQPATSNITPQLDGPVEILQHSRNTRNERGHELTTLDPKLLLKRLARAASISPIPDKGTQAIQPADGSGRNENSDLSTPNIFSDSDQAIERAQGNNSNMDELTHLRGSLAATAQLVSNPDARIANTPRVTGAWIDTPVVSRKTNLAKRSGSTSDPKFEPAAVYPTQQCHQSTLDHTESATYLGHGEPDAHGPRTTRDDDPMPSGAVAAPLLYSVRAREEQLIGKDEVAQGLLAARVSPEDTSKGIRQIEKTIEAQRKISDPSLRDTARISNDLRLSTLLWNEWTGTLERLFPLRSDGRLQFTWLGIFVLIVATCIVGEVTMCQYYCHPSYAYTMDGYGVDIMALRAPFVIISLIFGPLEWLWRPIFGTSYWILCYLTGLPALLGVGETHTSDHDTVTGAPRETIVYDLNEWARGNIGAHEIM